MVLDVGGLLLGSWVVPPAQRGVSICFEFQKKDKDRFQENLEALELES